MTRRPMDCWKTSTCTGLLVRRANANPTRLRSGRTSADRKAAAVAHGLSPCAARAPGAGAAGAGAGAGSLAAGFAGGDSFGWSKRPSTAGRRARAQDEQALLDAGGDHVTGLEVRIVAPRPG